MGKMVWLFVFHFIEFYCVVTIVQKDCFETLHVDSFLNVWIMLFTT